MTSSAMLTGFVITPERKTARSKAVSPIRPLMARSRPPRLRRKDNLKATHLEISFPRAGQGMQLRFRCAISRICTSPRLMA